MVYLEVSNKPESKNLCAMAAVDPWVLADESSRHQLADELGLIRALHIPPIECIPLLGTRGGLLLAVGGTIYCHRINVWKIVEDVAEPRSPDDVLMTKRREASTSSTASSILDQVRPRGSLETSSHELRTFSILHKKGQKKAGSSLRALHESPGRVSRNSTHQPRREQGNQKTPFTITISAPFPTPGEPRAGGSKPKPLELLEAFLKETRTTRRHP